MKCFISIFVLISALVLSTEAVENRLEFILYSKNPTAEKTYKVSNFASILSDPKFDSSKPTVILFYGFTQSPSTPKVAALKDAYLSNGGYNFIIVTIRVISYNVLNANAISDATVKAINSLTSAGYDLSKIEIVGFSLGAQIGALTARKIPNFPRLTGLDPGQLPPFPVIKAINPNDAKFVMTLHTEIRSFGDKDSAGHVDVWFNNARQFMCNILLIEDRACSHTQSLVFWAEAVRTNSATVFPARACANYDQFATKTCDASVPVAYINLKTPTTLRGTFYLNTNRNSPYSKATADP